MRCGVVKRIRRALGLTLEEMGRALMVSWVTVCRWENGKVGKIGLLHRTILEQIEFDVLRQPPVLSMPAGLRYAHAARSQFRARLILYALQSYDERLATRGAAGRRTT